MSMLRPFLRGVALSSLAFGLLTGCSDPAPAPAPQP